MSCATQAYVSVRAPTSIRGRFKVWSAIIMMVEALHEAMAMRRAAYRVRPMLDE